MPGADMVAVMVDIAVAMAVMVANMP